MKIVQYGHWKISVDEEKTKEYYTKYNKEENQANRNFAEYCKKLSPEEKAFFQSFGIDPVGCEIEHIGVSKKGDFPCGGYYLICGTYLEHPEVELISVEDIFENDSARFAIEPKVDVGIFQFDFKVQDNEWDDEIPEMPEGFICVRFWCEDMKWLLDEPCEEKMYEPPRFWEIHKMIGEKIKNAKRNREYDNEFKQQFLEVFEKLGINSSPLPQKEISSYKKEWLQHFAPEGADWKKLKKLCLKNHGFGVYLWHIFSYEILQAQEGPEAILHFNDLKKGNCIILSNIGDFAFELEDAKGLTAEKLELFVDVTITAKDFSWTYCRTHEEDLGPYLYM